MHIIKKLVLALMLIVIYQDIYAAEEPSAKSSKSTLVNIYINAVRYNKTDGLDSAIDSKAVFNVFGNDRRLTFDKSTFIHFYKKYKNYTEPVSIVNTSVLASNDQIEIIKVEMKFSDVTRVNYVTISKTGQTWKITNVDSVFTGFTT